MNEYFDNLTIIPVSEFLNRFDEHIVNTSNYMRGKEDVFERTIHLKLKDFASRNSISCHLGMLKETGLRNLILPHHAVELEPCKDPDREVQPGGENFNKVIVKYRDNYIPNLRFCRSICKIFSQQIRFFGCHNLVLKADFLFVSNDKELVHEGHYSDNHGVSKIYIGNGFHRFVAYGLWISQNGFKPLEVYYVEVN